MIKQIFSRVHGIVMALVVITALLSSFALVVPSVGAVDTFEGACSNPNAASRPEICQDTVTDQANNPLYGPDGVLTNLTSALALLAAVLGFIIIIIAGIRFALSGGDPNNIKTARSTLMYAIVGLLVAGLAQVIVILILNKV